MQAEARTATIVTSSNPVVLASMDKASFELFIGSSLKGLVSRGWS